MWCINMGLLADRFRAEMLKTKDPRMEEASADVLYPTGFLSFDYLNGYKVHVHNDLNDDDFFYNAVGIVDGSSNTIIGRSGSGKTTMALQMAANIVRPFPGAVIFYDDIESGSNSANREILTHFGPDEISDRIIYRNAAITSENFYQRISSIYNEKLAHKADYEYDTGLLDSRGNRIYKLVPTVYILDSLPVLTPEKLTEEEELSGQMSTTAIAKTNAAIFKRIIPKLKAANIILFAINHVNAKIEINPFSHSKAQIGFLKQGETLPGGNSALYLANNMIRVDDGTKLKSSEGIGVDGKIVNIEIIKSRTNAAGRSVPMVFVAGEGFDPIWSLYMLLKSTGGITSGSYGTLRGYEDFKFRHKEFKSKLFSDSDFAQAFNIVAKEELEKLLASQYTSDEELRSSHNIINSILKL